jgi:amino acid adenylation domain-containing protein/non-ribosomal peptide synthase protein (TIGR01720 family)
MHPSAYVMLASLPLTPNGKLDRKALPVPDSRHTTSAAFVAPATAMEVELARIWTEVLSIDRVSLHDNFFELGGHSLLATQVVSRVREKFGVEVPLRDLFVSPTLAGLARSVELARRSEAPSIERVPRDGPLPLSFSQQRLWFLDQLLPGSYLYNVPFGVRLEGDLDLDALRRTLWEVARRHETLRTSFPMRDGVPAQVVAPAPDWRLSVIDLSGLERARRETLAQQIAGEEAERPFDLARGPLARASALRLSPSEHVALFTLHHIVSDGWSVRVLVREVAILYEAFSRGAASPLPELPLQYADFAAWQRRWMTGDVLERQLDYWRTELSNLPSSRLPTDRPRPAIQSFRGATHAFELPPELSRALNELSRAQGATLFMTLLAGFQALLYRYSNQEDQATGTAIANRNRAETENLIGFFINTLVMRTDFSGEPRFRDVLERVRVTALGAYAHQDLPFERLVDELETGRDLSRAPLVQVMFALQNAPMAPSSAPGGRLTFSPLELKTTTAKFDLTLFMWEEEDRLGALVVYASDLFEPFTIARMMERFSKLLESAVAEPNRRVADLDIAVGIDLPPLAKEGERPAPLAEPVREPLSYHQERLWFIDRFESGNVYPGAPTYHNIPLLLHLEGVSDPERLEAALNAVVDRHEALRTRIVTEDDRGYQEIRPGERIAIQGVEPPGGTLATALELAREEALRPFSLEGPLVRASLYRIAENASLLLVVFHHIICDRRSLRLFAESLQEFHDGVSVPKPARPYRDFSRWQRELSKEDFEAQLFYWKSRLGDGGPVLMLPTTRSRPMVHTFTAASLGLELSPEVASALEALAARGGSTRFAVALAAFQAVLHLYAGQETIVVGTTTSGRRQPATEGMLGPLENLVVLKTAVQDELTFSELIERAASGTAEAERYQEMPFDLLVQQLKPEKDMSRTALFDVLFDGDEATRPLSFGKAEARMVDLNLGFGKYDLNLRWTYRGTSWSATLVYNADLFDRELMSQLLRHYRRVLEVMVDEPGTRVGEVRVLDESEVTQQLLSWNATDAAHPRSATIHGLFSRQAAERPEAVALAFQDERLTYGELDRRSNQLAHYLLRRGVSRGDLVALSIERSVETIVAMLAVLKAGAAYLPLDPRDPLERRSFILEDAKARHLLTTEGLDRDLRLARVLLDSEANEIAEEADGAPEVECSPSDLAYCIYTSGSTGKPKGVLVEHGNVVRLLVNDALPFAFDELDRWSLFHSYFFDFSVWEIYGALLYGGEVVTVPEAIRRSPDEVVDLVARESVTVLSQTPTFFYRLAASALERPAAGLALRYVVFGGEALAPAQLSAWHRANPGVRLVNMYGITETTVHVTFREIGPEEIEAAVSDIGGPIPTTTVYLLDMASNLLPVGVTGEMYVGGKGVARGYLERPALTAERFLPDPFGCAPGSRLYRTGDLARWRRDGSMEFLGRRDHQVKFRGFRIELGEIEAALAAHEAVLQAVVDARWDGADGARLVAYVTLAPGAGAEAVDTAALRSHLQSRLPSHMVPAAYVILDHLPVTSGGKVDRKRLPAPEGVRPRLKEAYAAPRTAVEEALAGIWAGVLGLDRVGVHDNFFELGGDSILSIRVVARSIQAGLRLTPQHIFQYQTIAELAAVAEMAGPAGAEQGLVEGPVPLTPIQHWFFEQDFADPNHFNQSVMFEVRVPLVAKWVRLAVHHLLLQHDELRARFSRGESGWRQVVLGEAAASEPVVSRIALDGLPEASRREALEVATAELQRSLDLTAGPVMRVVLFEGLGGRERTSRLFLVAHHLVIDGVSWRILLPDLLAAYEQLRSGRPAKELQLLPKTSSFRQWSTRFSEQDAADFDREELAFWQDVAQAAPVPLPRDRAEGSNIVAAARSVTVLLSREETRSLLQDVPPVYRTQINDVLLTALGRAFRRITGASAFTLDIEGHGREPLFQDLDTTRTVGWFTSLFPVRLDLSDTDEPGVALKSVKEQLRRVPRRGLGFGILRYLLPPGPETESIRKMPRAPVLFNYMGQAGADLPETLHYRPAAESLGLPRSPRAERGHLLEVTGAVAAGQLRMTLRYSSEIHERETIESWAGSILDELRTLIAHCCSRENSDFTPSDFPLAQLDDDALARIASMVNESDEAEDGR